MNEELTPESYRWIPPKRQPGYVLIAMHGSGGSLKDFDGLDEELAIPNLGYLYLNGPSPQFSGFCWMRGAGDFEACRHRVELALGLLAELGYPSHRCFLLGFSQGGQLAFEFTARYASMLAGAICISGHCHDIHALIHQALPQAKQKAQLLMTHGTKDQQLSAEIAHGQAVRLKEAGFNVEYMEFEKGHTFDFDHEFPAVRQWIKRSIG